MQDPRPRGQPMPTASTRLRSTLPMSDSLDAHRPFPIGYDGEPGRMSSPACLPGGLAFVVDFMLRCLVVEGDAVHLAARRPAEIIGQPLAEVLDPVLVARLEPHCREALEGHAFACEHVARGRAYRSRGMPLSDADGVVSAALVVIY